MDKEQLTINNSPLTIKKGDALSLPKGYKNTEVGVIPEDWEVKKLSEIGKFSKGSGVRKDEALSGNIPCVRYGELYTRHNDYIKQFYSYISKDVSETAKKLKYGDVLFAGSGETKEEIGKSVAFINDFEAFAGGDIVILSPENTNSLYLGYLLNATFIQKQKASRGQGDAVVHISSTQLSNISIPLPKEEAEQTAIATALSDADALINSLEKLIAKKRNIKQGAMQRLIVNGELLMIYENATNSQLTINNSQLKKGWEVKKLGVVCDVRDGTHDSPKYYDNGVMFVTSKNIIDGKLDFSEVSFISNEDAFQVNQRSKVDKGDILMSMIGTIGNAVLVDFEPDFCIKNVALVKPKKINPIFLLQLIYSSCFQKYIDSKLDGGIQKFISLGVLRDLDIPFPPLEEQTRIATILSDMDTEIQALETKLEKYRKIKLGMMQELLTGKIRLI